MNDTVAYSIGKDRIADLIPPARDVELRAEYCGRLFVSRLRNFEKISRFGFFERVQQPLVQDEQRRLLVLLYDPGVRSVPTGNCQFGNRSENLYNVYKPICTLRMGKVPQRRGELLRKTRRNPSPFDHRLYRSY